MGQLVVSAAAAAVGFYVGGPTGAQVGWAIGSMVSAPKIPGQHSAQPIMDLKVLGAEYGQPIPWVRGAAAIAGQMWWNTNRRATTTTVVTAAPGGKGGGGDDSTSSTTTYDMDCLIGLSDNEIVGIARIWDNGKLIYTAASGATAGSIAASAATNKWTRMTVYTGSMTQLPDPTYEAAVGAANAPAYRGRGYVFIEGLKLGGSGQVPNLTFEVVADGSVLPNNEVSSIYEGTVSNPVYGLGDSGAGYSFRPVVSPMTRIWASESGGAGTPKVGLISVSPSGGTRIGGATLNTTASHAGSMDASNDLWVARHAFYGGDKLWKISNTDFSIQFVNLPSGSIGADMLVLNGEVWGFDGSFNTTISRITDIDFGDNTCTRTTITNPTNANLSGKGRWFVGASRISGRVYACTSISAVAKWGYFDTSTNLYTAFSDAENWGGFGQHPTVGLDECIYGIRASGNKIAKYSKAGAFIAESAALPSWNNWGSYGGPLLYDAAGVVWVRGYSSAGAQIIWKLRASDLAILDTIAFSVAVSTEWPSFIRGDLGTGTPMADVSGGALHPYGALGWLLPSGRIAIAPPTVAQVVSALCLRAGLTADQIDVTALSTITRPVQSLALSQIVSTRQPLDLLASTYFFEMVVSDKIYFRPRGGASVATIPYLDLGASAGDDQPEPLALRQANELEIPAQIALTYININDDYQTDTQYSDRLITATSGSINAAQMAIGMTPGEAKSVADVMLLDQAASVISTNISLLGDYCRLEPTDPVIVTGADGSTFRLRLVKKTDSYPLLTFEAVLDDVSVLSSQGITSADYSPGTVVAPAVGTLMELMDIPILRDDDDNAGFYVATKGDAENFPGAAVFNSIDNVEYTRRATVLESAVFGTCTTTLGNWTGARVFDEMNSVTVNVGDGTLASTTRAAVLNSLSVNAMLIGSELIQFRTATLVSAGVYTLSGLLRGCRGTEWAMTGHAASERCVLLSAAGLRRVAMANSELGLSFYYKGVTLGRSLSSATAEQFTDNAIGLKPFNPFDLRAARDASNNITFTWQRRTRLAVRTIGTLGISVPLGEDAEAYEIDIYADGAYTTVLRTITATSPTAGYTAAQQTADGLTPGNTVYAKVYQRSAAVGRGYALAAAA